MGGHIEDFISYLILERKLSVNTKESYQFDLKEFEKFRPLNNRTATHSKPPPLGEVARLAVPERAFLPSQSLRASSPKGRAIVLTAFKVGCNKTCLKPSNSDL